MERTEIKTAYNQRNLDIKYSINFNKTIINVKITDQYQEYLIIGDSG